MKTGIEAFAEERQKQIDKHGFTGEHHANHPECYEKGQLLSASFMLAHTDSEMIPVWRKLAPLNWNLEWWQKIMDKPFKERLKIAGALLAAEWDRQKALGNFD